MAKVSVIMPIYNAEKYLSEAIESVLNQTFIDFELLLINDRSNDRSMEICIQYSKIDSRIVILENNSDIHGPGPTRNIGLDYAEGDYIYFMDADDWVEPKLLALAVKRIEDDNSDMVMFGSINEFYGKNHISKKSRSFERRIWTKDEIKANILEYWKIRSITLWSHLIKKSVIENIRFENISVSEDDCFFLDILAKAQSISYLNEWLYHYRILSSSICHRWHENSIEYQCVKWKHEKRFLDNCTPEISRYEYSEVLMMSYLRIIYELALPWCTLTLKERLRKIKEAQHCMELEKYRSFISYKEKKGIQKVKYFLVKKRMEKMVLILGMISLKWKKDL